MVRRVLALAAVAVAAAALLYTATSKPSRQSADAPKSSFPPYLRYGDSSHDDVQASLQAGAWRQRVPGPLHLSYSWLECNRHGARCTALSGLRSQTIVPPQELRIVTLRGVVTATNRFGSTSLRTSNFFFDMAGYPFEDGAYLLSHQQYDPDQLRAWYGLGSGQNGAGQTIVVTAPWRVSDLQSVVSHFSAHYDLPLPCASGSSASCFKLTLLRPEGRPGYTNDREVYLDVEWAHAIAPAAAIEVLEANEPALSISRVARLTGAHVFSSSWSWHSPRLSRSLYAPLAAGCSIAQVVCTWASGDRGHPGRSPADSPAVLAVGGSVFRVTPSGTTGSETAWSSSGGGTTSLRQSRPAWQSELPCDPFNHDCSSREIPDVSATAQAVPQFNSGQFWTIGGGTSLATPLWAALIALADQELAQQGQPAIGIAELHRVLYRRGLAAGLDDLGKPGWDAHTGWGSPKHGIVDVLVKAIEGYRQAH